MRILLITLMLVAVARQLDAQVEVAGFAGFYAPTSDFTTPQLSNPFGTSTGKQKTALAFGGLGRLWLDRRFALEGSLSYSGSDLIVNPPFSVEPDQSVPAHVTVGTVAALIRFPLGDLSNPVWASVGAAFVSRGGSAYTTLTNTSNLGGTVGLGTRFPLAGRLGIELGFKSLLYSLSLRDSTGTLPSHFQVDLYGTVGIGFQFGNVPDGD